MKSARQAFIKSESCERIRRALAHKMRASEEKYFPGDEVYYKRENSELWLGPGKVVFQDGKVVFIRHGHVYVRASVNKIVRRGAEISNCEKGPEIDNRKEVIPPPEPEPAVEEILEPEAPPNGPVSVEAPETEERQEQVLKLKKYDQIQLKDLNTGSWTDAKVLNRAVKLSSNRPDKNWFNVQTDNRTFSVNLDAVPFKIISSDVNEIFFTEIIPKTEFKSKECIEAKLAEIEKIRSFESFEVVEKQENANVLGFRWVLVRKNGKVRARLTAKGFQEDMIVRSDSPTVGKSTFRSMLAISVKNGWEIKTTDITSAFLQGDQIDREVLMRPPPEAGLKKNQVWKLEKPLYGLNDARKIQQMET